MNITAVLGAGSWGTALANLLAGKGVTTRLWSRNPETVREILDTGTNSRYLPAVRLSSNLMADTSLERVMAGVSSVILAVPCQFLGNMLSESRSLFPDRASVICASKGIELDTFRPMSRVVAETLGDLQPRYAILSGPSFAEEVVRDLPTAVALGCRDEGLAGELQSLLSTDSFRVYTNSDVTGVELGGALKNVMAIAAGISDGIGFGMDARAALITRGLAEMSRLGVRLGADERTFMGLSGMGDLVLTCTGDLSRNRQVGLKIGRGMKLRDILDEMNMVAEGVKTTEAVCALGREKKIELPISNQVREVLFEDKSPKKAVGEL
ncbi:MAG TPA: NAD(P)H-dependent glycerol-3-phosphate dehydrogenase, partial [Desulfomicrobiaceae bacterium]|nr:NAD(P)H-dependent glycerol-3-phosphate dehydrogenase [Desulfomicrobiaceae bacterium]